MYCTHCIYFSLDDKEIPYCIWENKCDINDCNDSRPFSERPHYEEKLSILSVDIEKKGGLKPKENEKLCNKR